MIRLARPPAIGFGARDSRGFARIQAGGDAAPAVSSSPAPTSPTAAVGPAVGDFVGLLAAVAIAVAIGWVVVRLVRRSPTRGLRAAVRKAKRVNEQFDDVSVPHPVPEMEARRTYTGVRVEGERGPTLSRPTSVSRKSRDGTASDALARLGRLRENPDGKDIRGDYAKLDTLVRRYLFDRYGVRAFSASATELLRALPQELTDSVVDYAGELLRVCEVAQLRGQRVSRGELRHLFALADELISGQDLRGRETDDDDDTDMPE